jgi:hypothetical protein
VWLLIGFENAKIAMLEGRELDIQLDVELNLEATSID